MTRRGFAALAVGAAAGALSATPSTALPADASGPADRGRALPEQFRGMWIATVNNTDWPASSGLRAAEQRTQLLTLFDVARDMRLNAVVLQVRPTADAFWPSRYEPWSQYLSGTQGRNPGWDPLDFAVREAQRRGLQLHAWFNPYRIATHADPTLLAPGHPARRYPEWVVTYGGRLYYNPGLPVVRRFVQDAMLDAVARYPVDGVHWDDYFYPYPVAGGVFDDDAAYEAYGDGFPDRASWRRHNIDLLVYEMAGRIKAVRPAARFGISPFGVWRNRATDPRGSKTSAGVQTYDDLYADTRGWIRHQWIDYICPQLYWNIGFAAADYAALVPWWSKVCEGTRVQLYIGEALYKEGTSGQPDAWQDPDELSRHLTLDARYAKIRGNIYFSARDVLADPVGAMRRVVADHYPTRARVPR